MLLKIFLIIACLSIALIALYSFYTFKKADKQVLKINASSYLSTTKEWKNYSYNETGIKFSLKYPVNWFLNSKNPNNSAYVPSVVFSKNVIENVYSRKFPCITVSPGIWDITTSFEEMIQEHDSSYPISKAGLNIKINVNGFEGLRRYVELKDEDIETQQVYIRGYSNKTYGEKGMTFIFFESCPGTDPLTFDQILSTFKFTD